MAFNKEKVMEAARKFVDKGQIDKAIKEYLRVVKEDPQDVRVWLKVGDLYAKKGSKQEAAETYLKVARFYQDQGFFLKAVAVYKQILKIDPRLVEVNLKLAELYRQLGLMTDAMQHFESVAAHFHREGKTKEALATVRQLVDLDPENIATRIKLAELYSKEGMNAEAVVEFTVACDQLRKQSRVDDFLKVAERLLFHKADNLPLNRELAVLYLRRNDPRRALQKLQTCFKADPRDVETLALLAQAFQALDQKSKTVSVLKELARVFDENKQRDKAEEVHRKILQFVPNDPDALAYLGDKAKAPSGDRFKAVSTPAPPPVPPPPVATGTGGMAARNARLNFTSEVAALAPPVEQRMTGSMPLVEAGDFALPEYEEPAEDFSAELDGPDFARGASSAGEEHADEIAKILTETDVYIKYGLHQKAIDHLRRVFALDPENLEARERLKDVLVSQGREREAIAELMKLAEATAPGDPDRAEQYLKEVVAIDGAHRAAFDLARRFKLDLSASGGARPAVRGSDAPDPRAGAVAPIDDDLDFDGIDFGDSSRRDVGVARADSFDGIDPAIFGSASAQGSPPGGAPRGPVPARPGGLSPQESTRQIAASEVEALAAMSTAPRALEFEDGVVELPPPVRPAWQQAHRSLDDVLDEQLDDSLGEDIDEEVAAELSGVALVPEPPGELEVEDGQLEAEPHALDLVTDIPDDGEELPFDADAARAFDAQLRGGAGSYGGQGGDSPPTFDPAAAAAFDADRPARAGAYPYKAPSAADLGAAPAESFDDELGLGHYDAEPAYDDPAADPAYDSPAYVHDATGGLHVGDPSQTVDIGAQAELAAAYDAGYAAEAELDAGHGFDTFEQHPDDDAIAAAELAAAAAYPSPAEAAAYSGATVDAAYDPGAADAIDDGTAAAVYDAEVDAGHAAEELDERPPSSLEDDLDEVDFYVSQDMMVEAADLLRSLLARHPGHPLVSAKLRDVEAQVGGYVAEGFARGPSVAEVDDGAIEEEAEAHEVAVEAEGQGPYDDDEDVVAAEGGTQNIDVDELEEIDAELEPSGIHELDEVLDDEAPAPAPVAKRKAAAKPAVMLERPVDEGDAETHYDLGLAYKEMGLWDEAVKAFEKVMANPTREVQCRLMIGLCKRDAGNLSEAVQSFKAALHARQCTDRERLSLTYEIGVTYEAMGDAREALYYFENVLKKDAGFLDVGDRVAALRGGGSTARRGPGDDSADLAIDSLLQDDL